MEGDGGCEVSLAMSVGLKANDEDMNGGLCCA